jgi:hypothetical protein
MRHGIYPSATPLLTTCSALALCIANHAALADDGFLAPHSLVISSSVYDRSQGPVVSLAMGTLLPNTNTATTPAISDNNYVTVWNIDIERR